MAEKNRVAQEKFNEINGQFSQLEISNLPTLASFIERVDQMFLIGGERYGEALASLREPIENSKGYILERIAEIGQQRQVTVRRFRTLDKIELLQTYPFFCWAEIAGALCTDLVIPLFFLWVLAFLAARLSPEKTDNKPTTQEVPHVEARASLEDASAWLERHARRKQPGRRGDDFPPTGGATRRPGGGNGVGQQPPAH
jgi:hypothetical protein